MAVRSSREPEKPPLEQRCRIAAFDERRDRFREGVELPELAGWSNQMRCLAIRPSTMWA